MKKVLIITYYWPPASGPGVQRWLKFAKYLTQYGWEPIILTVEGGSFPAEDEGLLREVAQSVQVHRSRTWEPFGIYNRLRGKKGNQVEVGGGAFTADKSLIRRLGTYIRSNYFIPDARIGWNKSAIDKASEIIKTNKIMHVVTTSPPHSSQLIGLELKKRHNIKWLADLRDPWMSMMYNQFLSRTKSSIQKDQEYEDQVLTNADHVTVVGDGMKREFEDRATNITTITNGYDASDISSDTATEQPYDKFTIFFMGNFLSQQSISAYWEAIKILSSQQGDFTDSFRMLIIGNVSKVVRDDIDRYELSEIIDIEPFQAHDHVIKKMKKCQLLYLPIPETEGNEMILTGKLFEYLASKLPILSIGPKHGDASAILERTLRAPILTYEDSGAIADRLSHAWAEWKSKRTQVLHDNDLHQQYERKTLTARMSEVLESL